MSKTYYSDFSKHCLRFYSRHQKNPEFKTETDASNWNVCDTLFKDYSEVEKSSLIYVYSSYDTIGDAVYEASKKYNIEQSIIWSKMKELEYKIARHRGLIA